LTSKDSALKNLRTIGEPGCILVQSLCLECDGKLAIRPNSDLVLL